MVAPTQTRVAEHTPADVNERIRRETFERVRAFAESPQGIDERLEELEVEWDIERLLETNAAAVSLIGLGLGAFVNRRWFVLPGVVAGFLLQHAVQGWCPPLSLFRRRGVRTAAEIEQERVALKVLRGDFEAVPRGFVGDPTARAEAALQAAEPTA